MLSSLDRFSTTPSPGQRRAIAVNLVMFFLVALTAVFLLTRTAIAANAINRDVADAIEPATGGIEKDTRRLPALDTTARLTNRIAAAAAPLSGHLDAVVDDTGRINGNLASTDESVGSIGSSVDAIKESTGAIRPAIGVLDGRVGSIHSSAGSIEGDLGSVAGLSSSIRSELTRASASLSSILGGASPLASSVRSINGSVTEVNATSRRIENSPLLLRHTLDLQGLLGNLLGGS